MHSGNKLFHNFNIWFDVILSNMIVCKSCITIKKETPSHQLPLMVIIVKFYGVQKAGDQPPSVFSEAAFWFVCLCVGEEKWRLRICQTIKQCLCDLSAGPTLSSRDVICAAAPCLQTSLGLVLQNFSLAWQTPYVVHFIFPTAHKVTFSDTNKKVCLLCTH